ncbi:MAG TPA: Os1348 family NHLP clan protein [Candidatus Xenobia bacterium]
MRVEVLLDLLNRTVNDADFRHQADRDPRAALDHVGVQLTPEEYEAFLDFHAKTVRQSAAMLV